MPTPTSWTQADLDAIETAIKSGVSRVKYSDREVQYRSIDELRAIRDQIRRSLGQTDASGRIFTNFCKGL